MKKLILAVIILLVGLLHADILDVAIEGGTYTAQVGDTVRVYVNAIDLKQDMRVIAYQFDGYYNQELLKYITHKPGDLFENAMLMANGDEPGIIKVACAHSVYQKGSGTLIELQFLALKRGKSYFQIDKFKLNSTLMRDVYDASIKIIGADIKE